MNVDLMSTIASVTGSPLPADRKYDSIDLSPTLLSGEHNPRDEWIFYGPTGNIWGARVGNYKLVYELETRSGRTTSQLPRPRTRCGPIVATAIMQHSMIDHYYSISAPTFANGLILQTSALT